MSKSQNAENIALVTSEYRAAVRGGNKDEIYEKTMAVSSVCGCVLEIGEGSASERRAARRGLRMIGEVA